MGWLCFREVWRKEWIGILFFCGTTKFDFHSLGRCSHKRNSLVCMDHHVCFWSEYAEWLFCECFRGTYLFSFSGNVSWENKQHIVRLHYLSQWETHLTGRERRIMLIRLNGDRPKWWLWKVGRTAVSDPCCLRVLLAGTKLWNALSCSQRLCSCLVARVGQLWSQDNHLIITITAERHIVVIFDRMNKEVYVNTPNECTSSVLLGFFFCNPPLIYAQQQHAYVFSCFINWQRDQR